MTEDKDLDPKGQSTDPTDPSKDGDDKSKDPASNDSDIPEQFKGKSAKEIAHSYIELQKTLGKQGAEVKSARAAQEELKLWRALDDILKSDPILYKAIQDQIVKQTGKKSDPNNKKDEPVKDTETRTATGNLIYDRFEQGKGIDKLSSEKQSDLRGRIGKAIASILDPKGQRPIRQVLDSIPLDLLPGYLDTGYKLATDEDREERARSQAIIEARRNSDAIFSDLPSSGTKSSKTLSQEEKEVARKLHMSDEDYLKNKEE